MEGFCERVEGKEGEDSFRHIRGRKVWVERSAYWKGDDFEAVQTRFGSRNLDGS